MRYTGEFTPLFRSTIGFDRLFDLLQEQAAGEPTESYPPYNIATTGEDAYRITMAVAGFEPDQIEIMAHQNLLTVSGRKQENDDVQYLHRGIASQGFQRRFELAEYVKVAGAQLNDGLLTIDLERVVPEAMKPRRITVTAVGQPKANEVGGSNNPEDLAA